MSIHDALVELEKTPIRVGHNVQDFDERAIRLVYPWWGKEARKVLDTLIMSRVIYPDIHRTGPNRHKLFPHEARMHGVKAWGKRLGNEKKDYTDWCKEHGLDPWAEWREEMQDYGEQDTEVGLDIFKFLWAQKPSSSSLDIEHQFAAIIRRMESWGWAFNRSKAEDLLTELQIREAELETQMIGAFGQFYMPVKRGNTDDSLKSSWRELEEDEDAEDESVQATRYQQFLKARGESVMVVPTRSYQQKCIGLPNITREVYSEKTGKRLKDYVGPPKVTITQGHAYSPVKLVEFNPSSRAHIWQRLMFKYGWVPSKFTPGGKNKAPEPVVDEDVLRGLPYPEADLLAEYFLVLKRIGQLATGQKALLKFARETELPNGQKLYRIHGSVNTAGTATGRCSHSDPNVAQVPKNTAATKDYPNSPELHGYRYRDLFEASPGYGLAGFDGEALELRMLAHYLFKYDKGEYADIVVSGIKTRGTGVSGADGKEIEEWVGTDPHSWLCQLIGEDLLGPVQGVGRDNAKTVMYADLYGAGNLKRGSIVIPKASDSEKIQLGKEIAAKMEGRFWAKAALKADLEEEARLKKHILGLDGRKLYIRKPHAALNTLLQSAGAVVMKKALIVLDRDLQRAGLTPGKEYEFVGNIHDEAQADILPSARSLYEHHAAESLPKAGRLLKLNCPLSAGIEFGQTWKDTH